jgi:hypothetical protein
MRSFRVIEVSGLVANIVPSLFLCYYEWKFQQAIHDTQLYNTPLPPGLIRKGIICEIVNIFLQIVSTAVLGWALARIKNKVLLTKGLSLN